MCRRTVYLALSIVGCLSVEGVRGAPAADAPAAVFKILVRESGVYLLEHRQLVEAGLDPDWRGTAVRLTHGGRDLPLWQSGAAHEFGPGERLVFLGEALRGETSFYDEHSDVNVYFLELGGQPGRKMRTVDAPSTLPDAPVHTPLERRVHLEQDELLLRFNDRSGSTSDPWFWAKLTQIDERPLEIELDLSDHEPANGPLSLRVSLRGWSYSTSEATPDRPDHVVEMALNGQLVATASWAAQDEHILEIDAGLEDHLQAGRNRLTIRVPRRENADGESLIDVVLLNWIEARYGRSTTLASGQHSFWLRPGGEWIEIVGPPGEPLLLFTDDSDRQELLPERTGAATRHSARRAAESPTAVTAVVGDSYLTPLAVIAERPSTLRSPAQRADYLVIGHASLLEAIEPLADHHRRNGLEVEIVDVVDIYDEFNHGILHPRAIRDFLHYAYHRWTAPAPRFVLLVGDASWDTKNDDPDDRRYADWTYRPGEVSGFVKNESTPYDEPMRGALRNLVPTWTYGSAQGHAASDNYFVTVDGDDFLPDMAIGRLPVATPQEVRSIVDKTVRYMSQGETGDWQRNLLWITNETSLYQLRTDKLAEAMEKRGFVGRRIYPSPAEADNETHQAALLEALDEGQLLVHFLGHGGRYIWRTGPPDFRKNHDLFTLDHLDRLQAHGRLPLILSMTCYSAPFDHPTADSIGEKFLRLADRGAVGVFAASWRNAPGTALSQSLLHHLTESDTVGEAILEAKRRLRSRDLIETYNLLGDPALRLALPAEPSDSASGRAASDGSP